MLTFKVYERTESTLSEIGTVISQIPGGTLSFCPGTIDRYNSGSIKAYSMLLTLKNGQSTTVPLSKSLSKKIAKAFENGMPKADILATIAKLPIYESEEGVITIGRPAGEPGEELTITAVALAKNTVTYETLASF